MRLNELRLYEDFEHKGLRRMEMSDLGQVVALMGPNGSGKTRILSCVREILTREHGKGISRPSEEREIEYRVQDCLDAIEKSQTEIKEIGANSDRQARVAHLERTIVQMEDRATMSRAASRQKKADILW